MDGDEQTNFSYKPEASVSVEPGDSAKTSQPDSVEWTASEYTAHHKSLSWYVALGLIITAAVLIAWILMNDLVSAIALGVAGIIFGVFAARPPRELRYRLDSKGLHIGDKTHEYGEFKSFTVVKEGVVRSIHFSPLQRFGLPINIYYAPDDEDKIVNMLATYLPYEERKSDFVDRIMSKIRF